jgi:hypothetical protein
MLNKMLTGSASIRFDDHAISAEVLLNLRMLQGWTVDTIPG